MSFVIRVTYKGDTFTLRRKPGVFDEDTGGEHRWVFDKSQEAKGEVSEFPTREDARSWVKKYAHYDLRPRIFELPHPGGKS